LIESTSEDIGDSQLSNTVGGRNYHHAFGEVKAARRSWADAHGLYQQLFWIDRRAAADQSRSGNK
jgi:hypothetical protein